MSSPKWPLFIGILCTFLNLFGVLYYYTGLCGWHNLGGKNADDIPRLVDPDTKYNGNGDEKLVQFTRYQISKYTIEFGTDIIMLFASILLIVGIKKKYHQFVAPWVFLVFLTLFVFCVGLIFENYTTKEQLLRSVASFIIIAMWYPVYNHYKYLRFPGGTNSCPAAKPCYTQANVYPCVPTAEFSRRGQQPASAPAEP